MKQSNNSALIGAVVRQSGFVVMDKPSADYPSAITVMYRHNPDGSLRWLLAEGGRHGHVLSFEYARSAKKTWLSRICFGLGLACLVADGKLKLYADPSTASYIRNKWHGGAF